MVKNLSAIYNQKLRLQLHIELLVMIMLIKSLKIGQFRQKYFMMIIPNGKRNFLSNTTIDGVTNLWIFNIKQICLIKGNSQKPYSPYNIGLYYIISYNLYGPYLTAFLAIKVFRNFKDELPLDSFSPLICFNHEDLIAVEFNLTGPAIIDVPSQYSVTGFDSYEL